MSFSLFISKGKYAVMEKVSCVITPAFNFLPIGFRKDAESM